MSLYCFNKNSIEKFPEETRSTTIKNIRKINCIIKCSKIKDCIGLNYKSNEGIIGVDSVCNIYRNKK